MYGVYDFGLMLADPVRSGAYAKALRQALTPGCTVLEIGSGTGLFALLARRWGAGRVYAVETLEAIELGPAIAAENDLADGIEFVRGFSTRVSLPSPADVLISDLRGTLPLHQMHIPSIVDARERLLASGGVQIPLSDTIRGAVVQAPGMYESLVGPWTPGRFGLDQTAARDAATNSWRRWRRGDMADAVFLTPPATWAHIDYTRVREPHFANDLHWTVQRSGTAHGFSFWFDAVIAPGIDYSTDPGGPEMVYGNAFFPLSRPVEVEEGDVIRCALRADLMHGSYVWTWRTRVASAGSERASFTQSTFYGFPLGPRDMAAQEAGCRPRLDLEGRLLRSTLDMMDGSRTLEDIAATLEESFPERFDEWDDALGWVRQLSRAYSDPDGEAPQVPAMRIR